jgi:hypothetical protein
MHRLHFIFSGRDIDCILTVAKLTACNPFSVWIWIGCSRHRDYMHSVQSRSNILNLKSDGYNALTAKKLTTCNPFMSKDILQTVEKTLR